MCECVRACITYTHAGVTLPAAPLFRSFCSSFSLVGESQEIERIMQQGGFDWWVGQGGCDWWVGQGGCDWWLGEGGIDQGGTG